MLKPPEERQSCFSTIAGILLMFLYTYITYQAALFLTNTLKFSERTALVIVALSGLVFVFSFLFFFPIVLDRLEKHLDKMD